MNLPPPRPPAPVIKCVDCSLSIHPDRIRKLASMELPCVRCASCSHKRRHPLPSKP